VAQTHSVIAKQHVDFFRKTLSRKRLLRWEAPGAAYVPFIGDGDIAVELYGDRRIYGADIDADRTAVAASRLPTADIRVADCDQWVFRGLKDPIAVADFDAYGNPYKGFNDFWKLAPKADRLLVFFTDGQGLNIEWKGRWHHPSGEECFAPGYKAGVSGGDVLTRRRVRVNQRRVDGRKPRDQCCDLRLGVVAVVMRMRERGIRAERLIQQISLRLSQSLWR
jgi:hypothetical protein